MEVSIFLFLSPLWEGIKVRPFVPVTCLHHQLPSCFLQNQVAGYGAEGEGSEGAN